MDIQFQNGIVSLSKDDFINLLADSEQLNALLAYDLTEEQKLAIQDNLAYEDVDNFEALAEKRFKEYLT